MWKAAPSYEIKNAREDAQLAVRKISLCKTARAENLASEILFKEIPCDVKAWKMFPVGQNVSRRPHCGEGGMLYQMQNRKDG